jgi:hypothetical protein
MQKTYASSAATSSTEPGTAARGGPACAACPHDRDAHDRIGTRFCAATTAGALRRGCVCVGDVRVSLQPAR